MTVIRTEHQKNYVIIAKAVLDDKTLSFKAKGIWTYCMSRPDDWQFHVSHLATVSTDGKDSVYAGLKELELAGYLRKVQENSNGSFGKVDYIISEIKIILPQQDLPEAEKPHAANPPLLSTYSLPRNDLKKDPPLPPPNNYKEAMKEKLKKKISFDEKEFEIIWKRLQSSEQKIFSPLAWLLEALKNLRMESSKESKEDRIKRHELESEHFAKKNKNIISCRSYVEILMGQSEPIIINYDCKEEEWLEKTKRYFLK